MLKYDIENLFKVKYWSIDVLYYFSMNTLGRHNEVQWAQV